MNMKPPRAPRTKPAHYELFVEHMSRHVQLRTGVGNPALLDRLWSRVRNELNQLDLIPPRSIPEWQTVFRLWKNATRSKARFLASQRENGEQVGGVGAAPYRSLTELEERALSLWAGNQDPNEWIGVGQYRTGSLLGIDSSSLDLSVAEEDHPIDIDDDQFSDSIAIEDDSPIPTPEPVDCAIEPDFQPKRLKAMPARSPANYEFQARRMKPQTPSGIVVASEFHPKRMKPSTPSGFVNQSECQPKRLRPTPVKPTVTHEFHPKQMKASMPKPTDIAMQSVEFQPIQLKPTPAKPTTSAIHARPHASPKPAEDLSIAESIHELAQSVGQLAKSVADLADRIASNQKTLGDTIENQATTNSLFADVMRNQERMISTMQNKYYS